MPSSSPEDRPASEPKPRRARDSSFVEHYGPWALVTGASSGIGEGFASALAAKGVNLVLVARRGQRLEALAARLHESCGVESRCLPVDLSVDGAARRVADAVADLDLGLVVHNAGTGWIGRFDLQPPDELKRLVTLHCALPIELTSLLLGRLQGRPRAGIVIVASAGAYVPLPYYAVYGATKAFLASWGEALAEELAGSGVDVLVLSPGDTRTEFQEVAGEMSTRWSSVEAVVAAALAGLGRRTTVIPGLENKVGIWLSRFLPRRLVVKMIGGRQRSQTPEDRR
jgi:short-subunit dehydrogenase